MRKCTQVESKAYYVQARARRFRRFYVRLSAILLSVSKYTNFLIFPLNFISISTTHSVASQTKCRYAHVNLVGESRSKTP